MVAESLDGERLLLGEAKVGAVPSLEGRPAPPFATRYREVVRAAFPLTRRRPEDVDASDALAALT